MSTKFDHCRISMDVRPSVSHSFLPLGVPAQLFIQIIPYYYCTGETCVYIVPMQCKGCAETVAFYGAFDIE